MGTGALSITSPHRSHTTYFELLLELCHRGQNWPAVPVGIIVDSSSGNDVVDNEIAKFSIYEIKMKV